MKPIKLQPHHLPHIFMAYRGRTQNIDYYDGTMKSRGEAVINRVLSNPDQHVQIVSGLDSVCDSCPYNQFGFNYDPLSKEDCDIVDGNRQSKRNIFWAKSFGVTDIVDKESIHASELLEKMEANSTFARTITNIAEYIGDNIWNKISDYFKIRRMIK